VQTTDEDSPQVTQNWCRSFVDKFVAAEYNKGFTFKFDEDVEKSVLPYVEDIWKDNQKEAFMIENCIGKNTCGDSYIHVHFEPKYIAGKLNPDLYDPYDLYEKGRVRLFNVPASICFPKYKDGYDREMESCTILFPVPVDDNTNTPNTERYKIVKYVYTNEYIEHWDGKDLVARVANKYGVIPIFHFRNQPIPGDNFGLSDLEDLIPLNVELNLKNSDMSQILDYHASPVTCVFGARAGQLEKGANKVWSGLPKDGKVENIELKGDMGASTSYRDFIKQSMHEIGSVPRIAMGAEEMQSNLSGIALHIAFGPFIDIVTKKRLLSAEVIEQINKYIIRIGIVEKLFDKPDVGNKKIYNHEVIFGEILPKDLKLEMEQIQLEMKSGMEDRRGAMKRLKKDNIEHKFEVIEQERKENPNMFGITPVILSPGQKLINPETGEVIADVAPLPTPTKEKNPKTSQTPTKAVGENKEGEDIKINSGISNINPGKENE
jgi:hypothetical protein